MMAGIAGAIRRWLGIAPQGLAPQEASSFVCREAVLNRNERIGGYEFSLKRKLQARMLERSALIRRAYDEAMLHNLAPLGVSSLLGDRLAFIRLSADSLENPLLEKFSGSNTVVMVAPAGMAEAELAGTGARLRSMKEAGIRHGWAIDRPRPEMAGLLREADFIEVETATLDGIQLKMMCREFREAGAKPKLVASRLQTFDDFNLCYQCGFDYFMGPFVSSRENWHPAKSEINRLRVFEVLNMIRAEAGFDAIAERLRTEPILTFKLLRYINSPGVGLLQKIDEISQALLVLGRERFYRWLSLLLFDFNQPGYREHVLNEQALARARFLETLAGCGRVPQAADQLFMTGLFSLLDVIMNQPLAEVLKQVSLSEAVAAALNGEPGAMRDALRLGVAVESGDPDEMAAAAVRCGLEAKAVTGLMIEALAWSRKVSAAGE